MLALNPGSNYISLHINMQNIVLNKMTEKETFSHMEIACLPAAEVLVICLWISVQETLLPTFIAHPRSTASFPACGRHNNQSKNV